MIENILNIKSITESFGSIWEFIKKLIMAKEKNIYQIDIPKRTIIIAPNPNTHNTWWHMGSSSGQSAMQVVGRFKVTNITRYNILLCAAKMKKPKVFGYVMVKDSKSDYHGSYQIPPTGITDLSFDFMIIPPLKKEGEPFTANVAIIDQFGNEHWIKGIQFIYS